MNGQPIIVKMESQRCKDWGKASYNGELWITQIENIGLDKAGKRWRFTTEHHHHSNGLISISEPYDFVLLSDDEKRVE